MQAPGRDRPLRLDLTALSRQEQAMKWREAVLPLLRPWCWLRSHQRVTSGRDRYCYVCLKDLT